MTQSIDFEFCMTQMVNLEADIKTVVDASVPNKQQNRAAQKMVADYFWKARNRLLETVGISEAQNPYRCEQ